MTAVCHFQQTMSGCSCQNFTVFSQKETCHVTWDNVFVEICNLYIIKTIAVIGLKCTIHTHIEQTVFVLYHAVHIVAGHAILCSQLFL